MPFPKGHKLSPGGKKGNKGGRPTKQVVADEARAKEIALELLARGLGPVIDKLKTVVFGVRRMKFYPPHVLEDLRKTNPKCKPFYYEMEYDPASIRFWIDRFVPAARADLNLNFKGKGMEAFNRALDAAKREEEEEKRTIESEALPEPDPDKVH